MTLAEQYVTAVNELDPSEHYNEALYDFGPKPKLVSNEYVDSHRWYNVVEDVLECADGSFFAVLWCEPATEMQEDQDRDCEAYLVEPREVTVTKYVKTEAA